MSNNPECPYKNICSIFQNVIKLYKEMGDLQKANEALKERLELQREISGKKERAPERSE
jgi:hypothetical protein